MLFCWFNLTYAMYKRDFVAAQGKNLKDIKTEISVRVREAKFTL